MVSADTARSIVGIIGMEQALALVTPYVLLPLLPRAALLPEASFLLNCSRFGTTPAGAAVEACSDLGGNVISFGLFLSPVPTFCEIWRKKAVEDFSPIPYLATLLNCMLWVFYGTPVVHPHSLLVITINGIGLVLESIYLIIFICFATRAGRCKVFKYLAVEMIFVAALVLGVLLGAHTYAKRSLIVGVMCVIFGTAMYAAPLAAMRSVIRTRSVKYMPLPLSLASFLNGVCWTLYALLRFDIYITIPNVLGTLLSFAQLLLYGCYYSSTPKEDPKAEPKGEIQLPTAMAASGNGRGAVTTISIQQ